MNSHKVTDLNVGGLSFTYGMETDDLEGNEGKPVFNANTAVWITFCRNLFGACQTMYRNRESAGCFVSTTLLKKMKDWQNTRPERIWVADTQRKYLRPWEDNGTETFLPMLAGRKVHQREQVKTYNMYYYASKYVSDLCTTQNIMVRGNTPATWVGVAPQNTATLKMYADCYIVITSTSNNVVAKIRAKRGVSYVMDFPTIGTMTETELYFCTASMIQELGGLAHLYFKQNDFSKATNLQRLEIGSNVTGYSNPNLQSLTIGNSKMLEYLDVRNCPNVTGALDLSGCLSLKTVYLENTNFTGVTFATGGLLETAHLPSPTSLTLKNLVYLTDLKLTTIAGLVRLCMENCIFDDTATLTIGNITTSQATKDILINIIDSATNLSRVRLVGIDWNMSDTSLLDRMLTMSGIDDDSFDIAQSVLIGDAYTPILKSGMKLLYNAAWPYLNLTYSTLVAQYEVAFMNADETPIYDRNGQPYVQWVDSGDAPYDPVTMGYTITVSGNGAAMENGYRPNQYNGQYYLDITNGIVYQSNGSLWSQVAISDVLTPTIEPTPQYLYTFSGWDNITSIVITPRTVTAQYSTTTRTYTVTWWRDVTTPLEVVQNVPYGADVVYPGGELPSWTGDENVFTYRLFKGWDTSTGSIKGNTNVYAQWDVISALPPIGKRMDQMRPVEIYAVCQAGMQDDYGFQALDYTDITLGHDYNFINIESLEIGTDVVLNDVPRDTYVSGGYYFDGATARTTDIVLFGENSPSFTMAIDFQFANETANQTIVTNQADGQSLGFRIYMHNGYPAISFGGSDVVYLSRYTWRTMVVIRHLKGSDHMYVYHTAYNTINGTSVYYDRFSMEVLRVNLPHRSDPTSEEPLTFGGVRNFGGYRNYTKGVMHWCKIWFDDLGDTVCKELALWPREKIRMEYWDKGKYMYAGTNTPCKASFVANNVLGDTYFNGQTRYTRGQCMDYDAVYSISGSLSLQNTNIGGWEESIMREFLNGRIYKSLPFEWQQAIKNVEIKTTTGGQDSAVYPSSDKLYLPSYREVGSGTTSNAYYSEIGTSPDPISWFANAYNRPKWNALIRKYQGQSNFVLYTSATEPSLTEQLEIVPGAIWVNSTNGYFYMYMPQEYLEMYGVTPDFVADTNYSSGGWIRAVSFWDRSPYLGNSTSYWHIYFSSSTGYTNGSTGTYSVMPCFSL